MDVVNEKSTSYLGVTFKDNTGAQSSPSGVTYRIDCLTTGQSVLAVTSATAGAAITITITPDNNAIINPGNNQETKRVTVIGSYNAADEVTGQYDYIVQNLTGVS